MKLLTCGSAMEQFFSVSGSQFYLYRRVILAKGVALFHWSAGGSDAPKFAAMLGQKKT